MTLSEKSLQTLNDIEDLVFTLFLNYGETSLVHELNNFYNDFKKYSKELKNSSELLSNPYIFRDLERSYFFLVEAEKYAKDKMPDNNTKRTLN